MIWVRRLLSWRNNKMSDVKALVKRISMRGFKFEYIRANDSSHVISVTWRVPDSEDESKFTTLNGAIMVFEFNNHDEKFMISRIYDLIRTMVIHEAGELFRVDGKAIFNSHVYRESK